MTDTAAGPHPARTRRRWLLPAIAVLVAVGATSIAVAVASNDTAPTPAAANARGIVRAENIAQACSGWAATEAGDGSASTWCNSMTTWMNQQITSGHMTGTMMWSDPTKMLAACRAWISANADATYPSAWCPAMVEWMSDHATTGGWTSGMTPGWTGTMMGGRATP